MGRIDVKEYDRVTVARTERSTLEYLLSTMGGALIITLAVVVLVVYSALFPTSADEVRVVRGPGTGFYDAAAITGEAARDIRSYMDQTWVECDDLKGYGRCNLNASTASISVRYRDSYAISDAYALAYLAYTNDTGNRPAVRFVLWEKRFDGRYPMRAFTDDMPLVSDISMYRMDGTDFRVSGLTQGPKDAFCCPKKKTDFDVTVANGKLKVTEVLKPRPAPRKAGWSFKMPAAPYGDTMFRPMNRSSQSRPKAKLTGFDFNFTNYAGEGPLVFFHHDSEMMLLPRHGIIAYRQPNETMGKIVTEGDELFHGQFGKTGIVGTAYVFKAGCPPLPYRVSGPAYDFEAGKLFKTIVLRGAAPVHARSSCAAVRTTPTGPNAVLVFEPAGAYSE